MQLNIHQAFSFAKEGNWKVKLRSGNYEDENFISMIFWVKNGYFSFVPQFK